MTTDRSMLHELVDELPEEQVAGAIGDIRGRLRGVSSKPLARGAAGFGRPTHEDADGVDELLADALDGDAVQRWLREEVACVYDATIADPSRSVSMDAVRARLAAERSADR